MQPIERPSSDFKNLCLRLGYRRKTVRVWPSTHVTLSGLNWSGGSKSEYHAFSLIDGKLSSPRLDGPPPWANPAEGVRVEIPPDTVVVSTGWFSGKPATIYIYVRPENMPMLLEEHHAAV
jgi:hypothetical protein